ncbi:MAG: YkgJ family cysteine cluster protein [Lachnospiraceae bacterium]|nr:YkgJ family cysteine cluster protein [Candidatus Colinaster scatohippi]
MYELSLDGKKYNCTDVAPVGCNDCEGCSICCREMGDTIIQDPFDMWMFCSNMRLSGGMQVTFELLVSEDGPWELSYQDGLLLPNIKMVDDGHCSFLNEKGRCSIHKIRSGLCRLFPLGRGFEEDGSIYYYVLNKELGCEKMKGPGDPVGISEWLGYEDIEKYELFQVAWHRIKRNLQDRISILEEKKADNLRERLLLLFFDKPYGKDFYSDFAARVNEWMSNI